MNLNGLHRRHLILAGNAFRPVASSYEGSSPKPYKAWDQTFEAVSSVQETVSRLEVLRVLVGRTF